MAEDNNQQDEIARGYADIVRLDQQAAEVLGQSAGAEFAADSADPITAICTVWRRIRLIVIGAANFPLLPGNIRSVLKQLISVLDGICGSNS
jgi:hypothetical protein